MKLEAPTDLSMQSLREERTEIGDLTPLLYPLIPRATAGVLWQASPRLKKLSNAKPSSEFESDR